jgi:UDP-GlcNAc:undecaprenyl-phosphate/decaprenyl-phosphate GlcNAc-1-phosphate transferase
MQFLIYNFFSFLILFFVFILRNEICSKLKLVDYPNDKSVHREKALLFGGIFLISSLFLNIIILILTNKFQNNFFNFFLILSFFFVALIDDIKNLNPNLKIILSIIICFIGISLDSELKINNLFFFYSDSIYLNNNSFFNYVLPILCILLFLNAFNFIDGINGLASTVGLSFFLYLIIKNPLILNLYYFFIISLLFFLFINTKYKVFLGDSGNYLISICIAMILLKENSDQPSLYYAEEIFLLLLIPGLDMLRLFIVRIFNKNNPFKGDHNHLHHRLFDKFGNLKTVLIYLVIINLPIYIFFISQEFLYSLIFISITTYFILLKYTS